MDAVESGETLTITRNGAPVAELRPIRRRRFVPVSELQAAFAVLPAVDFSALRADIEEFVGDDDRIGDADS